MKKIDTILLNSLNIRSQKARADSQMQVQFPPHRKRIDLESIPKYKKQMIITDVMKRQIS